MRGSGEEPGPLRLLGAEGELPPANTLWMRFFIQRQPGLCLREAGTGHLPRAPCDLASETQNLHSRQALTLPFAGQMPHGLKKMNELPVS